MSLPELNHINPGPGSLDPRQLEIFGATSTYGAENTLVFEQPNASYPYSIVTTEERFLGRHDEDNATVMAVRFRQRRLAAAEYPDPSDYHQLVKRIESVSDPASGDMDITFGRKLESAERVRLARMCAAEAIRLGTAEGRAEAVRETPVETVESTIITPESRITPSIAAILGTLNTYEVIKARRSQLPPTYIFKVAVPNAAHPYMTLGAKETFPSVGTPFRSCVTVRLSEPASTGPLGSHLSVADARGVQAITMTLPGSIPQNPDRAPDARAAEPYIHAVAGFVARLAL